MKIISCAAVVILTLSACTWIDEGERTAREEIGPRAMVQKYNWFKDASAQLSRKKADLKMYDARIKSLKENKASADTIAQAETEKLGVASSYNDLAASYNAAMAKIHWRFANTGEVPDGEETLPREFKSYIDGE